MGLTRPSRSPGARIYTLNSFAELTAHADGTTDLTRLAQLGRQGRLDGQVGLQACWRDARAPSKPSWGRTIAGKAVLHVD